MGESRRKRQDTLIQGVGRVEQVQAVGTPGGRMHVGRDAGAAATPRGQLVFFAEFLAATGVFDRWVSACQLALRSGNAPDRHDALGSLLLGRVAGHRRAHEHSLDAPKADARGE